MCVCVCVCVCRNPFNKPLVVLTICGPKEPCIRWVQIPQEKGQLGGYRRDFSALPGEMLRGLPEGASPQLEVFVE